MNSIFWVFFMNCGSALTLAMENLRALDFLIQSLQKDANRDRNHEKSEEHNRRLKKLLTIACTVGSGANDGDSIEERVDKLINEMVSWISTFLRALRMVKMALSKTPPWMDHFQRVLIRKLVSKPF